MPKKTRVIYDKLPPGAHTVIPIDTPGGAFDPGTGFNQHHDWQRINLNDLAEVDDINDPKSHRAYQVRGHLNGFGVPGQYGYQGPLATLVSGPPPAGAKTITEHDAMGTRTKEKTAVEIADPTA